MAPSLPFKVELRKCMQLLWRANTSQQLFLTKDLTKTQIKNWKMTSCASILSPRSSFACGLAGALASNPVDVVRTRMMNQRGAALYQGTLDCILRVGHTSEPGSGGPWGQPAKLTSEGSSRPPACPLCAAVLFHSSHWSSEDKKIKLAF